MYSTAIKNIPYHPEVLWIVGAAIVLLLIAIVHKIVVRVKGPKAEEGFSRFFLPIALLVFAGSFAYGQVVTPYTSTSEFDRDIITQTLTDNYDVSSVGFKTGYRAPNTLDPTTPTKNQIALDFITTKSGATYNSCLLSATNYKELSETQVSADFQLKCKVDDALTVINPMK